jgi:tRNA threonylcarbamoyladenosine biosynthesis protein TsaE
VAVTVDGPDETRPRDAAGSERELDRNMTREFGGPGHDAAVARPEAGGAVEDAWEVVMEIPTAAEMRTLGTRLGALLRPGDLIVLTGDLGAGKTTLTQGIGEGMKVRGPITSPTFVIARVHPPLAGGPALVHVDAYRLGGFAELDDLDLDASAADSVTVVEWGQGLAEGLADARLEVIIYRSAGADETRRVKIVGVGGRWSRLAGELR